MSKRRKKLKQT